PSQFAASHPQIVAFRRRTDEQRRIAVDICFRALRDRATQIKLNRSMGYLVPAQIRDMQVQSRPRRRQRLTDKLPLASHLADLQQTAIPAGVQSNWKKSIRIHVARSELASRASDLFAVDPNDCCIVRPNAQV